MKRKLYFLAILMCILGGFNLSNLNAQTTTVTIGDETKATTNAGIPFDIWASKNICQQLFTANEINHTGGTINSIAIKFKGDGSTATYDRKVAIYINNSTDFNNGDDLDYLNSGVNIPSSQVANFDGTITLVPEEWVEFVFTTPFEYTGGNIIVTMYDYSGYSSGNGYYNFYVNTVPEGRVVFINTYDGDASNFNGYSAIPTIERNIIKFTIEGGTAQPQPQIIEIGAQTGSSGELPTNIYYKYSLTQQIYTKDEIGVNKDINITSIAFKYTSDYAPPRNLEIYMSNITANSCGTNSVKMESGDLCFDGTVNFNANDWTTINFTTPFEYEAGYNILLCVVDKTGSWENRRTFAVYGKDNESSFYAYMDSAPYSALTSSSGNIVDQKNCIKLEYEAAPPKPLSLLVSADKETVYTGEIVQLTATASGGEGNYTYSWSPATGLNNTTSATPTFTPTTAGTYNITCEVTSATETATDNVTIVVNERPAAPSAPTGLQATVNGTSVTLNWNSVTGATSYNVYTNNGTPIETTDPTYTITGLNPATTYCFTVTAVNIGGESSPSDEVCVKTDEIKRYRIKSVDYEGKYLNIAQITSNNTGGKSGVDVAAYAESDGQIFTIEDAGYGNVYFRSASGYYINCLNGWMVSAHGTTTSSAAFLKMVDKGNNTFAIQCNDGYFKVEEVSGGVYPFSNGNSSEAALWTLEEVGSSTPDIPNEGCEIIFTLIGETSNSWGSTSGLMVYYTGGPDGGDFLGLNDGSTSKTYTYNLPQGSKITVTLLTGNYPEEMGFTIAYANGVVLAQYNIGEITSNHNYTSPLWQKTVDCSLPVPNVIARAIGKSGIELTWDDINIANGYNVYDEDDNLIAENLTESSYVIKGLNATSEYCFTVTAVYEDDEESEHSELACATTLDSDVQEGVIGDGGESKEWIPIATYCKYSYSQQSYTKNEIANAGGAEGYISSVSYYVTSLGTTTNPRNLRVFLSNVDSQNEITFDRNTYQLISEDLVYEGPVTLTAGWVKINFQKPFKYNGNHIVITVIDDTGDTDYGDTYFSLHEKDENYKYWVVRGNSESKIDLTTSISGTNYAYRNDIKLSFVSEDVDIEFIGTGAWNDIDNWNVKFVPTADKDVIISGEAYITNDVTINSITIDGGSLTLESGSLTVTNSFTNTDASAFVIKDGAQVFQTNEDVKATFRMNVKAPASWTDDHTKGWQFIASPMSDFMTSAFETEGIGYDLFKYVGGLDLEWVNYKGHTGDFEEAFKQGRGYIASYETVSTVEFEGTLNNDTSFDFPLNTFDEDDHYANFHLLGNPFAFDMKWNNNIAASGLAEGYAIVTLDGGYEYATDGEIKVGDGFFVKVTGDEPSLSYNANTRNRSKEKNYINIIASGKAGKDNVIINFNGDDRPGFAKLDNFNKDIAVIYVQDNGKRSGILSYDEDVEEINLYFDAKKMGEYTINAISETDFASVTLVDLHNGNETDLLTSSYTFKATSSDDPDRFVLRISRENTDENFIYRSGDDLVINAKGMVQIIDIMGRIIYSENIINGSHRIDISNYNSATYIVRVVNANEVKTQKIVVY